MCGRPDLCEREEKRRRKKKERVVHTPVSIFGDWSVQVSERVSWNKFHFMHEYRDISV